MRNTSWEKKLSIICVLFADIPIETLSLLLLPYLFKSSNVKTGNKKRWKPSKIEIAESFIFRVSVSNFFCLWKIILYTKYIYN